MVTSTHKENNESRVTVQSSISRHRWFSPGTSATSTTKTDRHYIAEILLKVALSTINQIKSNLNIIMMRM
jgi:hypothetical protein